MGIGMYHKIIDNFPVIQSYFTGVNRVSDSGKNSPAKLPELKEDVFEKSKDVKAPELNELSRLFPNNEIYKIFDDIVKEYGLENPPSLEYICNSDDNDFASASHISNKITLNLDNILTPNIYKFLVEKDGKKAYCKNEMAKSLRTLKTTNQADINTITDYYLQSGADKCSAEPLSDEDKRKMIIFSLAHELEHFYQNQVVRHTEGLDEFDMIKTQLSRNSDIKENILEQLKQKYESNYGEKDKSKIYSQDSPEGKLAQEWYQASINYTDYNEDYETYANNPLEADANDRANKYLTEHFGDFTFEIN